MREHGPSLTAQRVAAYRLGFDRMPAPFGDPAADALLAADIAGSLWPASGEPARSGQSAGNARPGELVSRYMRGRTMFFDRVVVEAIDAGVGQIASIAAGYDGRSLRYAQPEVRWFEIDHHATQADKRERLQRLGIPASNVTFIAADVRNPGLPAAMAGGGWDPGADSLLLCEGLAVYLEVPVLESLIWDLRKVARAGSRLAISLATEPSGSDAPARRERFRATIDALGEPARNGLSAVTAKPLLTAAHWRITELSERARAAGFVIAVAV